MKFNNQVDDVFGNPFVKNLLEQYSSIEKKIVKRKDFRIKNNNYNLLKREEKKVANTFRLVLSLKDICKDFTTIKVLINKMPPKKYIYSFEINELDYIKYHHEVFIHKIHTVLEIMKLLSNEILNLELSEKECDWAHLIKQKNFRESKLKRIIELYYSGFKSIIEHRHLNTHRGIYQDEKRDNLDTTLFIYQFHEKYGETYKLELSKDFENSFPRRLLDYEIRSYKSGKLKEIEKLENVILKYIKLIFQSI